MREVGDSLGACEQLEVAANRETETEQPERWDEWDAGEIRVQANMRPIGYAKWQRTRFRQEYGEACERNRLGAGRHGASKQLQQAEEEPHSRESLGRSGARKGIRAREMRHLPLTSRLITNTRNY